MTNDPQDFARELIDMYYGDYDAALQESYNAARAYDKVPCSFWRDVALRIVALKEEHTLFMGCRWDTL